MLNVYKVMSENVSSAVAANGENVTKQPLIKSMRTVKKETLKLITSWVSRSCDPQIVSVVNIVTAVSNCVCFVTYLLKFKLTCLADDTTFQLSCLLQSDFCWSLDVTAVNSLSQI